MLATAGLDKRLHVMDARNPASAASCQMKVRGPSTISFSNIQIKFHGPSTFASQYLANTQITFEDEGPPHTRLAGTRMPYLGVQAFASTRLPSHS